MPEANVPMWGLESLRWSDGVNTRTRPRIDLGIAIAHQKLARRGIIVSHRQIAAFCDCTKANIWLIEQRAIHKLKRAAHLRHDPVLKALVEMISGL